MNEAAKHRIIIKMEIEGFELDNSNQCTTLVPLSKLKEYGITSKKIYKLDGENLHEALMKLKSILDKLC